MHLPLHLTACLQEDNFPLNAYLCCFCHLKQALHRRTNAYMVLLCCVWSEQKIMGTSCHMYTPLLYDKGLRLLQTLAVYHLYKDILNDRV